MEQLGESTAGIETKSVKPTSLTLTVFFSPASFSFAFVQDWSDKYGLQTLSKIGTAAFNHPQAFSELVAAAIGGSILLPLLHVAIASLFKSKRNPSSRRRIFIGWSILVVIVGLLALVTKSKAY